MSAELSEVVAKVAALEARIVTLEALLYRRAGVSTAVNRIVDAWPGPFTAQQIYAAVIEKFPQLSGAKFSTVDQRLRRLEKQNVILRTHQGKGCIASIFERAPGAQAKKKPGAKFNRKDAYESGFRHIVRAAMASESLPEEFTLADLRKWMAENCPEVQVPYGSWSSTLYKLQNQGELVVAKPAHTLPLKVYRRGERRVMPSGDELKGLEAAWEQFKKEFPSSDGEAPKAWLEAGSILQRAEIGGAA